MPDFDAEIHVLTSPIRSLSLVDDRVVRIFDTGTGIPKYQVPNYTDLNAQLELTPQPSGGIDESSFFGTYRWIPLGVGHNHEYHTDAVGVTSCVSSVSWDPRAGALGHC